jgi:carbamoyl-phosphate synthase small subunit
LNDWCKSQDVPIISGIDTRALVKILREKGTTLGKVVVEGSSDIEYDDPNNRNLVAEVSVDKPQIFHPTTTQKRAKIALIDCGVKQNIIRCLVNRGAEVHLVPHNYDVSADDSYDGVFVSNGPGNPEYCSETVETMRKLLMQDRPLFGICMGNLLLGMAAGMSSKKLKFGNRSHNQAVMNMVNGKCSITSQNHGFALDDSKLPEGWMVYYRNIHDESNEGIYHVEKPFRSVQFHPEAAGGPQDTVSFFDEFLEKVDEYKSMNTAK